MPSRHIVCVDSDGRTEQQGPGLRSDQDCQERPRACTACTTKVEPRRWGYRGVRPVRRPPTSTSLTAPPSHAPTDKSTPRASPSPRDRISSPCPPCASPLTAFNPGLKRESSLLDGDDCARLI
uniref:Uncharacterized protein n=1 Tax=Plectus sambesii TaxID=2011161 RepID=A0A914V0Z0_9BILA